MTTPPADDVYYTLRDGTKIHVRRIGPHDAQAIADGLKRMSPESRYRRFMAPTHRLTSAQLAYLTQVDQRDHLAWGAGDASDPAEPGIGVARCVRLAREPAVAEAAVAVVDSHHGLGLGTLLLGILARDAVAHGIHTFRGYVLADNGPAMHLFEELGAVKKGFRDGMMVLDMSLDPARLPDTPAGRVFRAVAQGEVPAPVNPFSDPPRPIE